MHYLELHLKQGGLRSKLAVKITSYSKAKLSLAVLYLTLFHSETHFDEFEVSQNIKLNYSPFLLHSSFEGFTSDPKVLMSSKQHKTWTDWELLVFCFPRIRLLNILVIPLNTSSTRGRLWARGPLLTVEASQSGHRSPAGVPWVSHQTHWRYGTVFFHSKSVLVIKKSKCRKFSKCKGTRPHFKIIKKQHCMVIIGKLEFGILCTCMLCI